MRYILDIATGEIIDQLNDGDRILRKESMDYLQSVEKIPDGEKFVKMYREILPALVECSLAASDFAVFMHLAVNLRYRSNIAKYSNGQLITRESLTKDLKISDKSVKRSILKLISVGLIVEAKTIEGRVFVVNPYVANVGDSINKTTFELFRRTKWARW